MQLFFTYNWQVREEWFEWCKDLSEDELWKKRTGGTGTIIETLLHIIDVEYSWINVLKGNEVIDYTIREYDSLEKISRLSRELQPEMISYLQKWNIAYEHEKVTPPWMDGTYKKGEIIRHVIAHEIHHIGQLSVWAREIERKPVGASFIDRGLMQ
ncbi:DinB family protein [Metabacillus idriensis]|uniref:DinB family protein n=1 Tax=Metabacillus idriensis TaxID=324768 RepID=UPI003D2804C9